MVMVSLYMASGQALSKLEAMMQVSPFDKLRVTKCHGELVEP